ncbi:hypothetical protein ACP70R_023242 [Stipagrostis hirtigluma subsp. patula]
MLPHHGLPSNSAYTPTRERPTTAPRRCASTTTTPISAAAPPARGGTSGSSTPSRHESWPAKQPRVPVGITPPEATRIFSFRWRAPIAISQMASSKQPCATLDRRVAPALAASSTGVLPEDAVFEILLRLLANDLCRLRAVCRPWRSLLSDRHFIAAHAARHPLIVAGYGRGHSGHSILCDILDLSRQVVKRVRPASDEEDRVVCTHLDLICTVKGNSRWFRLINPANGTVYETPEELPQGYDENYFCVSRNTIAFGQVASTGEYKVLTVHDEPLFEGNLCQVLTLDGSIHARWRVKKASPDWLDMPSRVVVNAMLWRTRGTKKENTREKSIDCSAFYLVILLCMACPP